MKHKQFEDQVNLPIWMDSPDEIQYNVNSTYGIQNMDPGDNLLKDFFQFSVILLDTEETPILGNSFTIFYVSDVVVMYRRRDHEKTTFELLEDGNVLNRITANLILVGLEKELG